MKVFYQKKQTNFASSSIYRIWLLWTKSLLFTWTSFLKEQSESFCILLFCFDLNGFNPDQISYNTLSFLLSHFSYYTGFSWLNPAPALWIYLFPFRNAWKILACFLVAVMLGASSKKDHWRTLCLKLEVAIVHIPEETLLWRLEGVSSSLYY